MIVHQADRRPRELQPGVQHTVLSYNDDLMLCEVSLAKGVVFPTHAHPHVQIVYVVRGRISIEREGRTDILAAGESCALAPDESHGVTALEDALVIDAFHPVRADFVAANQG
jgi:quercetin dioxygenase-like cupin family protein